ncbi:unnamed protein product [Brassica oleracea var. botrytis]|nr:unnamed protein product [Brassica napus]
MKQYRLRPNGGIMASLNLFATKFDETADKLDYVLVDTPWPDRDVLLEVDEYFQNDDELFLYIKV